MKRHTMAAACAFAVAMALPLAARAQYVLVQSDFAAGADGWLNVMLPYPSAVPPTIYNTYTPAWIAGHIEMADPDGSGTFGNAQYWQAPGKFLGYQLEAYGGSLAFDVGNAGSGNGPFDQEDIILVGGGITLVYDLASTPGSALTHYDAPMLESAWHKGGLAGPVPTHAEFMSALGSVTQLFIRAEYQLGPDTQLLDNVVLSRAAAGVDAIARPLSLELSAPSPNPSARESRIDFVLPHAGDADVAVFDAAGRRVATLAHGAMAAGAHALAWDGAGADGRGARAGLYWVRLSLGERHVTRRLVRIE